MSTDPFACRCQMSDLWPQCASRATQEDMFCDVCREFIQAMKGPSDDPRMKSTYLGMHCGWHHYEQGIKYIPGVQSSVGGNYTPYEPS